MYRKLFALCLGVLCSCLSVAAPSVMSVGSVTATITVDPGTLTLGGGIYRPEILPNQVRLSDEQVAALRGKIAEQYMQYHQSLIDQNVAAAAGHQLWARRATAQLADDEWHLKNAQEVYANHRMFSSAIFWMVMLIVAVALALTIHQFSRDGALARLVALQILGKHKAAADPAALEKLHLALRSNTDATISATGIKLGTQIVGLVILAFAMGFFYLYLVHVYPVTVAQPVPPPVAEKKSDK